MRIDDKVNIALAIALLGVLEGVIHFAVFLFYDGQRAYRLAENGELFDVDADFAHLSSEHKTFHTNDVADVEFLEDTVVHRLVRADFIAFGVDLDSSHGVLDFVEGDGTHDTLIHDTAGDADILELGVVLREFFQYLGRSGIYFIFGCRVGIDAKVKQVFQFFSADDFLFG